MKRSATGEDIKEKDTADYINHYFTNINCLVWIKFLEVLHEPYAHRSAPIPILQSSSNVTLQLNVQIHANDAPNSVELKPS